MGGLGNNGSQNYNFDGGRTGENWANLFLQVFCYKNYIINIVLVDRMLKYVLTLGLVFEIDFIEIF